MKLKISNAKKTFDLIEKAIETLGREKKEFEEIKRDGKIDSRYINERVAVFDTRIKVLEDVRLSLLGDSIQLQILSE